MIKNQLQRTAIYMGLMYIWCHEIVWKLEKYRFFLNSLAQSENCLWYGIIYIKAKCKIGLKWVKTFQRIDLYVMTSVLHGASFCVLIVGPQSICTIINLQIIYWIHHMVSRILCYYESMNFSRNWVCLFIVMYW